jgi:hypothetical protein
MRLLDGRSNTFDVSAVDMKLGEVEDSLPRFTFLFVEKQSDDGIIPVGLSTFELVLDVDQDVTRVSNFAPTVVSSGVISIVSVGMGVSRGVSGTALSNEELPRGVKDLITSRMMALGLTFDSDGDSKTGEMIA